MKANIGCILILFFITLPSFSQIKVINNGNVGIHVDNPQSVFCIGGEGSTNYKSYIYNSLNTNYQYALVVKQATPSSVSYKTTSIYGGIESGTGYAYGIKGYSSKSNPVSSGRSYGVFGYAANATNGYNYAVYGYLGGSNNGAAIFGAIPGKTDLNTNGIFAGFFRGNVYCEDKVGIKQVSPSYELDVNGYINCTAIYTNSNSILKENITDINSNNIEKILLLHPVEFNFKNPDILNPGIQSRTDTGTVNSFKYNYNYNEYSRKRFGFIAQEVNNILPELVHKNEKGIESIDYLALIPLLVKAIKEQQNQIETLQSIVTSHEGEIIALKQQISNNNIQESTLKGANVATGVNTFQTDNNKSGLFQNIPNPFQNDTEIKYNLASDVQEAVLYVYDLQGKEIKSFRLSGDGIGRVIIKGNELEPGMYLYSLVADNQLIDMKRMILTK